MKSNDLLNDVVTGLVLAAVISSGGLLILDSMYHQSYSSHLLLEIVTDLFTGWLI